MVFNTISYMWMGWDGIGYLPGAVLRAPDGANNKVCFQEWEDVNLAWNASEYDGVSNIR